MPSRTRSTSTAEAGTSQPGADGGAAGPGDLRFEHALRELEEITEALDSGTQGLDDLVTQYERGMQLLAVCQSQLDAAQLRIEQISRKADGGVEPVPFPAGGAAALSSPARSIPAVPSVSPAVHDDNDDIRLF